jgi:MFS transporter, FHS family, Na+ dependent glucose transporter 1
MTSAQTRTAEEPVATRLTAVYFLGYAIVGLLSAMLGPSMQSFVALTGASLGTLAILFTTDAFGSVCGSLLAGRLMGRLNAHLQIAIGLAPIILCVTVIPMLRRPVAFAIFFWALGLSKTFVFVTVNTLLLWVRRAKVGPFINAADFFLGAGSLTMPLLIGAAIGRMGGVTAAYWVVGVFAAALMIWALRVPAPLPRPSPSPASRTRNVLVIGAAAVLLFLYVGAEISVSGWLPSFALLRGVTDDAATAAYFTSLFWMAVTAGRLCWVPVAQRVHPAVILVSSLVVCALAIVAGATSSTSVAFMSTAVVVIGLGMSSIFPSTFALLARKVEMTGMVSAVCLCAASLGAMFFPWLIGQVLTKT